MQTNSEWIKAVRIDKVAEGHAKRIHRVTSPYDIPEAFRVISVGQGRFLLEFRYIDASEGGSEVFLSGDVKAVIGKSTKRLLAIDFKPADHDPKDLLVKLHKVIQQLSEKEDLKRQAEWNYRAARDAMDRSMPKIEARFKGIFEPALAH